MTHEGIESGSDYVPRSLTAPTEAALSARGDVRRVNLILEHSPVPLLMVDDQRRFLEANRPARLAFRLSLDELRSYTVDELSPPDQLAVMERAWARLLDTGRVAGPYQLAGRDGSRLDIFCYARSNVLPGLHLAAIAPADWPEDELGTVEGDGHNPPSSLTPREIEVLALAADGFSGPELAQALVLSRATVSTHFQNIYAKLEVRSRAAAVAKAMRLGAIY